VKRASWNPYLVGVGIGVLSWLAFFLVNKPIGMSTEISKFSGWAASWFIGIDGVKENAYWAAKTPKFGYSTVFLICTALGALVSAVAGGTFRIESVPKVWNERFGASPTKRYIVAFIGGFLLLFGARLAGGCTSGHGISGTLQLGVSSWLFFAVMLAVAMAFAQVLFHRKS
jgi:uncharacterized membrane protein YedE/YeeE